MASPDEADVTPSLGGLRGHERQLRLLGLAREQGFVDVTAASTLFTVAPETIRRDLRALEEQGLVRRTYGSAYPVDSVGYETDLHRREVQLLPEKRRIASEAVRHLRDAESIFVDEGFTPQLIAQELPTDRALTVVTASLPVATILAPRSAYTVIMLGGRVRGRTFATVEHWVTRMLAEFVIDLAFVGANGISPSYGLSTPDPAVAEVKRAVIRASRRNIFAGVHVKFSVSTFCRFAEVSDLELIVTDTKLSQAEASRYSAMGPNVIRA